MPNNSLKTYSKDINNINCNITDDDETPSINCNYVDINSFDYTTKKVSLSLFHLYITSLSKNKDELETILNMIDLKFGVVGITETKIKPTIDININGCNVIPPQLRLIKVEHLYIDEHNAKPLPNIDKIMYKSKKLESVFIEMCNKNKENTIVSYIYRHPSMDLNEFNQFNLNPLMGDFLIDLLRVDVDTSTTNLFDVITANLLVPDIMYIHAGERTCFVVFKYFRST